MPDSDPSITACTREIPIVDAYAQYRAGMHIVNDTLDHPSEEIPFSDGFVARAGEQHLFAGFGVRVELKTVDGASMRVCHSSAGLQWGQSVRGRVETVFQLYMRLMKEFIVGLGY